MPYRDAEQQREYQRRWKAGRRAAWFADKTCEWCGTVDALEIHHRDPSEKISHKIWSWAKPRREAELAKCVVLCRGCHEGVHWPKGRRPVFIRDPRQIAEDEADYAEWMSRVEELAESIMTAGAQSAC